MLIGLGFKKLFLRGRVAERTHTRVGESEGGMDGRRERERGKEGGIGELLRYFSFAGSFSK